MDELHVANEFKIPEVILARLKNLSKGVLGEVLLNLLVGMWASLY